MILSRISLRYNYDVILHERNAIELSHPDVLGRQNKPDSLPTKQTADCFFPLFYNTLLCSVNTHNSLQGKKHKLIHKGTKMTKLHPLGKIENHNSQRILLHYYKQLLCP